MKIVDLLVKFQLNPFDLFKRYSTELFSEDTHFTAVYKTPVEQG